MNNNNNIFTSVDEMMNSDYDVAINELTGIDEYLVHIIKSDMNGSKFDGCIDGEFGNLMDPNDGCHVTVISADGIKICIHKHLALTTAEAAENASIIMNVKAGTFTFSKGLVKCTNIEIECAKYLENCAKKWIAHRRKNNTGHVPAPAKVVQPAGVTPAKVAQDLARFAQDTDDSSAYIAEVIVKRVKDAVSLRNE